MSIISVVLILALLGVVVWLVITYVPMPAAFKTMIPIVAIILAVIWILKLMGVWGSIQGPKI